MTELYLYFWTRQNEHLPQHDVEWIIHYEAWADHTEGRR